MLGPAVKGTVGLLEATKKYGHQVKRVIITSSFAAMVNADHLPAVYDETSWNPITWEQAVEQRNLTYRGSKVGPLRFLRLPTFTTIGLTFLFSQALAEKAAWEFMDKENPSFDLVALNPPLVYGPVAHHLESLAGLNTSNQNIRDFIQGKFKGSELPPTGTFLFTDVRDIALAHVRAIEVAEAGGRRFFITGGHCSHKMMIELISKVHPQLLPRLPQSVVDDFPAGVYGYNNRLAIEILGVDFHSLERCMQDTVTSITRLETK